jgi:hypothetical protein
MNNLHENSNLWDMDADRNRQDFEAANKILGHI